ncbi:uncharacterized protein KY384_004781 [Bacidia gigantensis]|uniref:uncharacterized protein n=1 Tax=Bacidia gigantensis TaxID=2732470 RepID=UPI001D052EBB|nr:uncharacterized protein KY384_004781 [Bacidia gigantensis]KAG8530280.1 hypothetical protein KY384_004781 [Bacidia gigantensis]
MPAVAGASPPDASPKKPTSTPDRKYKCSYCNRAFSRSEHRSRHERSHTKERPFKCAKCRSTFVRRDLLLRHDRTVHAKDGGIPLSSEVKRRTTTKAAPKTTPTKPAMGLDTAALEQIEASSDGMVDLETAAMLMTDLHHKATAQMASQEEHLDDHTTPYSPDHTVMFDAGHNPFMTTAVPMPQMPWENFMPNSVNQPKASSISSASLSGSQDTQLSQLSFNSASTLQPHANHAQLPPMMERFPSNNDALAPSLQNLNGNIPISGPGTPNGLSPFPFMTGPVSPVDYRRSPGPSQPITTPRIPQIQSEEDHRAMQENMRNYDTEEQTYPTFQQQSRADLNSYLESYFKLFHHHLPFLHPDSFNARRISPPLLLSVLSIGSLYSFNPEKAFMFHVGSKVLNNQYVQNSEDFSSRNCPLWVMQSTLLNMIFASWSGDAKGLEWTCSIKSLVAGVSVLNFMRFMKLTLTQMVSGNRYELNLRTEAREGRPPSHSEWVEDEGCRRTYYAVYIFFGMLTLTYNHTPAINFNEFESLILPATESLWNLDVVDEEVWQESLAQTTNVTVRAAYDSLFQGEKVKYSAFATRVMINALSLEVWSQKGNFDALQDVVTEYKLRLGLETWEGSLELCEPETMIVQLNAPDKGHPLIFNSMAVYRNTRARLEVDLKAVQEAIRYHNAYEVNGAMTAARDKVKRSQEMIKVIEECFNSIEIVAQQGIRWVGRTCATNWSIEHPLCNFDLILILSLWLYRLEHDEEHASEQEISMYNKVRTLFEDEGYDVEGRLGSVVAKLWGEMLDEVVVWGITKLMGEAFKLHAQTLSGYDDAVASGSDGTTPTMSSQEVDLDMASSFQPVQA